jgi:fatty-acyl-CoA synthase
MAAPDPVAHARAHALGDTLRRTALRHPDKLGLVAGGVRWSFAELDAAVNRTANALAERGVGKGDRIAILSRNGRPYVVLAYALARLGAVMVPINFMLNAGEVGFILGHAKVGHLVAEAGLHATATEALAVARAPAGIRGHIGDGPPPEGWEDVEAWIDHDDASDPGVLVGDDEPLRLMYTSGTESRPKGALLTSRSLLAQYVSCIVDGGMEADDVEVHSLPLYHCAQLDCFLGPDIYLGATSIVLPGPDPALLLKTIEEERVTKLFAPPTIWIGLLRSPHFETADVSSLRKGYYGASPMPVEILREMQRRLPGLRLWNFYGQTEMAPLATILRPDEQEARAGSAGKPALNVETRLVDDDGNQVGPGEIGEIVHRSPHATLGYLDDPEKTAEAFRDGWFHSGDLGVVDEDGYLTIVDRKKDVIKSGGENVASREVEEAIYALDGVAEVAVFGIPDPYWVEAVTAAVVAKDGHTLEPQAVRDHCRARLAGFKSPKHVVILDALPKNPSGKILKRELRDTHAGLASAAA